MPELIMPYNVAHALLEHRGLSAFTDTLSHMFPSLGLYSVSTDWTMTRITIAKLEGSMEICCQMV